MDGEKGRTKAKEREKAKRKIQAEKRSGLDE
jgi:hypothetical protein